MARGEQNAGSDIDLLVISDTLSLREIVATLSHVQRSIGREINPVLYRSAEARRKIRGKHPFLTRVVRDPKLLLLGDAP